MDSLADAEIGPIDYLLLEFPEAEVGAELGPLLRDLVDRGLVRLLDLAFIRKDADGTVTTVGLDDVAPDQKGILGEMVAQVADLVTDERIAEVAAAMAPGTSGGLLVWENAWAAPFATGVRRAGGAILASGRIPASEALAAMQDDAEQSG